MLRFQPIVHRVGTVFSIDYTIIPSGNFDAIKFAWRIEPNRGISAGWHIKPVDWPKVRTFKQLRSALNETDFAVYSTFSN